MSSYTACNCSYAPSSYIVAQCRKCQSSGSIEGEKRIKQQRIWRTVRVASTLYQNELGSLNVVGTNGTGVQNNSPLEGYSYVNWNQMSDRAKPGKQLAFIPTRGNSTKSTITSLKPGGSGPGGIGVDVKHGSYARYLARKKGSTLTATPIKVETAKEGNKTKRYNIIDQMGCACTLRV